MGADVIKVEQPIIGDLARELGSENPQHTPMMGSSFVAQNAGKRSVTVDLKTAGGRDIFERLIRESDVLLENMRPGVLARLGFPWSRIHELNSRIIYCAVSGFGQTGPLSGRPAYDQIIQGLSGMAGITGFASGTSVRAGFPVADSIGGFAATMAICAALAKRATDGIGCFLDVSMLETSIMALGWAASDELIGGHRAGRNGNDNVTAAPSGTFETANGALNIAANTQQQYEQLCRVLGAEILIDDVRFRTRAQRKSARAELTAELEERLRTKTAAEWEHLLAAVGVPSGRVLDVHEALEQEQIVARGLLHSVEITGSKFGNERVIGSGIHVDGRVLAPAYRPPTLGEHSHEVLKELGYGPEQIDVLQEEGAI
jgi:crotonobetainyl-CoA:carnitine CoA-transferase CaiB-like acyl-CoA transferase